MSSAIFIPLMNAAVISFRETEFHHTLACMHFVPTLLFALYSTLFESSIDRVFLAAEGHDWPAAASALDEAFDQDARTFDANNLHYLRGRIAENQSDWIRARDEFNKVGQGNPLQPLAVWHAL